MKTAILSGSSRKGNNTIRVARAIQRLIPDSLIVDYQDYDLPSYNQEEMLNFGGTPFQKQLITAIKDSDFIIVLTPEYNWFPSAEIVNTIHHLGTNEYSHLFDNKVFTTVGVSAGRGGRMPMVQLSFVINKVIQFFSLNSITSPKSFEAQEVPKCINEEGELLANEAFNKGLKDYVAYNVNLAKRWRQLS
jgi:chromate reductase